MFSIGKAEPRPYSKTLERAGMSCVVVTNTFTQLGLDQDGHSKYIYSSTKMLYSIVTIILCMLLINEPNSTKKLELEQESEGNIALIDPSSTNLELMRARALSA